MSLWSDLTGIVSDVVGGIGDFFGGAGDVVSDAVSSVTDIGSLMDGMGDAGNIGGLLSSNADWLVPLGKAGIGAYLENQATKDYLNQMQPLINLSKEQQALYRQMMDPQNIRRQTARERKRMLNEQMPFLERATGQNRMLSRAKGTPWGASSEGNVNRRKADEYAMNIYDRIANQAQSNVQNQIANQMKMMTGQVSALNTAPQYQPIYQMAATSDPLRGFLSRYLNQ